MKRIWKIAACLAGGLALNAGLHAATPAPAKNPAPAGNPAPVIISTSANNLSSGNPYAPIATRNIFGLVAPAPPPDPKIDEEKNLPKITPSGIFGVFGHWQVMFKVATTPTAGAAKPGPAKDDYYTLSEGQRQDEIEVIKIDEKNSLVTFNNHGYTQELPLANTPTSGGSAGAAAAGGNPGMPLGAPGGGNGGAGGFPTSGWGASANNGGTPKFNPAFNNGAGPNGANSGMSFGENTQGRVYQPEPSNLTPEQSQIILVANHADAIKNNDPSARIFPPSVIDSQVGLPSNVEDGPPMPH